MVDMNDYQTVEEYLTTMFCLSQNALVPYQEKLFDEAPFLTTTITDEEFATQKDSV